MNLVIRIEKQSQRVVDLVGFYMSNLTLSYISHGDIQLGRALSIDEWSPHLDRLVGVEFREAVTRKGRTRKGRRVVSALLDGKLVGLAVVFFHPVLPCRHTVLEDMVVDRSERGKGIGSALLAWVEREAALSGAQYLFLESGIENKVAHEVFDHKGFTVVSKVMLKTLPGAPRAASRRGGQ